MQDEILQIGKILSLSSTKTRGNTLNSLVESILYSYDEELSFDEVLEFIHGVFNIKPFPDEVKEAIDKAVDLDEIIVKSGKYILSRDKHLSIFKEDAKTKNEEEQRFKRFESLLYKILLIDKVEVDITKLWSTFNEYLYECFYQYGENAVSHFFASDYKNDYNLFVESSPFRDALNKLGTDELKRTFRKVAISFIQNITHEDIEYLESLSKKTIAFHSLGLPKELHDDIIDLKVIDWTIYVDTNFLFSVLNLHKHPENKACEDLLILAQKEDLNIKFRYTPFTMSELKQKRSDFEDIIPKSSLRKSHISALLKSENLDSYSEAYYENLLINPESTLHPTEIIELADKTIQTVKNIGLHNSKFDQLSDDYIKEKVVSYQRFIELLNSLYIQKSMREIYKSPKQLYHDMFLREVIEYQQRVTSPDKPKTMSEIKVLGVTLDKLLIKYDKNALSQERTGYLIPNFHLPSFLLNKLYRLLPLQTEDYKKAFISAIATFSFSQSTEKSRAVQKFVNYYRNQGLEDEKVLLSFITDGFFLDKFFEEDTPQDDFFESEINKKLSQIQIDYERANSELTNLEEEKVKNIEEKKQHESLITDQKSIIDQLKDSEKVLFSEIQKISRKSFKTENNSQLTIDAVIKENEIEKENKRLKAENEILIQKQKDDENDKRQILREAYIKRLIFVWRMKSWTVLGLIILIVLAFILYQLYICNWNIVDASLNVKNKFEANFIFSILIALSTIVINVAVIRVLSDKYNAHNNIKAFTEKIDIPKHMRPL